MRLNAVDQELLELTQGFNLEDWRVLRTEEHWIMRDSIKGEYAKKEFLLKEVKRYLNQE